MKAVKCNISLKSLVNSVKIEFPILLIELSNHYLCDSFHFAMTPEEYALLEPKKNILIKGAQLHNLKNIDVAIPRNQLVVITGLSGSGKSSLAFDTLYAEGQRRYVESLSSYARQFLGRLDKPKVE